MRKSIFLRGIATLALCVLTLTALGSAKNRVTRPFKIHGNVTMIVELATGHASSLDVGQATHSGVYVNVAEGQLNQEGVIVWAKGTATDANGDQNTWEIKPGAPNTVIFTSGTGKYAGLTGGFDYISSPPEMSGGPEPGTVTITFTYIGDGTITY